MTTTGQKRVLRSEKFSTFGWESSQRSDEASPLYHRNISPAFDETEATIFSFFGTKITSQGVKSQASDKRLPEFLEKKGDYSFGREDEDLVLSDPSSDEKGSDGSEEDSPALGHYNSSMGRDVALFPVALQNFEKKLKSAAKNKSEETHLELGNVKSHIITEPEKTSNVAKTKGKPAETRSQDQQEIMRLKMIVAESLDEGLGRAFALFEKKLKPAAKTEPYAETRLQGTSLQKHGVIQTKLNNSVYEARHWPLMMQVRGFSHPPEKTEFPTDVNIHDFSSTCDLLMWLRKQQPGYDEESAKDEMKEHLKQLEVSKELYDQGSAERGKESAERGKGSAERVTPGELKYKLLAIEAEKQAMVHLDNYRQMKRFEIYCREMEIEWLEENTETDGGTTKY